MTAGHEKKAVDWVERAKSFYRATGKEIAIAEFTNPHGQFVQSQQYIFVLDLDGTMLAHGINHWFVGKNFLSVKDSNGKEFIRDIVEAARKEGAGWTHYKWYDPVTRKELPKSLYFEKIDDVVVCCGTYREVLDPSEIDLL